MLKKLPGRFFARYFFPVNSNNWYKEKGYAGENIDEQFNNFCLKQQTPGAIFYQEFKSLILKRCYIESGRDKLDSVMMIPEQESKGNQPSRDLVFIMFFGKGEYFESRWRDMARLARATGARILAFNFKGMRNSSGQTHKITDLVADGIAVVEFLFTLGVRPQQIVMLGNSLGAAIQGMVNIYFKRKAGIRFRQINSNSFKTMAAVIASRYHLTLFEKVIARLLHYADWEITVDASFYQTGIYLCYMSRYGDRTILPAARYHVMVNRVQDYYRSPPEYRRINKLLNENSELINPLSYPLIYSRAGKDDPHYLPLYKFRLKLLNSNGEHYSVYDFINCYLRASDKYIKL